MAVKRRSQKGVTILVTVIASFRCAETGKLYGGKNLCRFRSIERQALVRLRRIDAAESLNDLAAIPGNRLEGLSGDRKGQHSIRINDQWRICFRWSEGKAYDVEIVDYH
jgi:proteic killer suppression protein